MFDLIFEAVRDSMYMLVASTAIAYVIGLPLGVLLVVTDKNGISPNAPINFSVGVVVNILRSVPFLILMIDYEIGRASCRERV